MMTVSDINVENQIMKRDVFQMIMESVNKSEATIIFLNIVNGVPMKEVAKIVGLKQSEAEYAKVAALKRIKDVHPELKSYLQYINAEVSDSRIFKKQLKDDD